MTVRALYFARIREETGLTTEVVDLPDQATVEQLLDVIAGRHEVVAVLRTSIRCGVNDRYVPLTTTLKEGDEVAILSPVSGG